MEEEKKTVVEETQTQNLQEDLLAEVKKLKENSVSKKDYEELSQKYKNLFKDYCEGKNLSQNEKQEENIDIQKLRNILYGKDKKDMNNLDYVTNVLKLREGIIKETGSDPFLPKGRRIRPTENDKQSAEHVAEVLKYCVDYAKGSSEDFTSELSRRIVDIRY